MGPGLTRPGSHQKRMDRFHHVSGQFWALASPHRGSHTRKGFIIIIISDRFWAHGGLTRPGFTPEKNRHLPSSFRSVLGPGLTRPGSHQKRMDAFHLSSEQFWAQAWVHTRKGWTLSIVDSGPWPLLTGVHTRTGRTASILNFPPILNWRFTLFSKSTSIPSLRAWHESPRQPSIRTWPESTHQHS